MNALSIAYWQSWFGTVISAKVFDFILSWLFAPLKVSWMDSSTIQVDMPSAVYFVGKEMCD